MASTNQTPHLGLSQWVLTDPFRMDDFNQDNAKIDAAVDGLQGLIDAMPYVKLMEVTTTADADSVWLDVSGIDFTQYAMVQVFASAVARFTDTNTAGDSSNIVELRAYVSGRGATFDVEGSSNNQYFGYAASIQQAMGSTSNMQLTLSGFQKQTEAMTNGNVYYQIITVHCAAAAAGEVTNTTSSCNLGGRDSRVTSISFSPSASSNPANLKLKANSKFAVYGVRI